MITEAEEREIRATALALAVEVQVSRGVSNPVEIAVLAEYYAAYIRAGPDAIPTSARAA